jgi:ligand-binding sensor domain-containing protein
MVSQWQIENGLPDNGMSAVAQTKDGYLWVGTYT